MIYGWLADLTVWVHLGWIGFLLAGALPGRRRPWLRRLHLAGLAYALVLSGAGWVCPLTHLELWLRTRGGMGTYPGSFLGHWAERLVYLPLPRALVVAAAAAVTGGSLWLYWRACWRGGGRRP